MTNEPRLALLDLAVSKNDARKTLAKAYAAYFAGAPVMAAVEESERLVFEKLLTEWKFKHWNPGT